MGEYGDGGEVVGHDQHGEGLALLLQVLEDGADYAAVYGFDGARLALGIALMSAFVGSLEVHEHEVAAAVQKVARRLCLALEIGGQRARRAFDIHALHAGADGDAFEQVHRAHHAPFEPVTLAETLEGGAGALSPKPYAVRRIFAG